MTKDIARCTALEVIYQILEEGAYANLGLDKALFQHKELSRRDRGFITEMVYGSVKYKARLDWIINKLGNIKIDKHPNTSDCKNTSGTVPTMMDSPTRISVSTAKFSVREGMTMLISAITFK